MITTLYDPLKAIWTVSRKLRQKLVEYSRSGNEGFYVKYWDLTTKYDGGEHESGTFINLPATKASCLSLLSINLVQDVFSSEHSDFISRGSNLNPYGATTVTVPMEAFDFLVFKRFLSFGALRAAKAFVNFVTDKLHDALVNAFKCSSHCVEKNEFKPF